MSENTLILLLLWISAAVHAAVLIGALKGFLGFAWIPALNGLISASIVGYWLMKWYGYLFKDIRWSLTDQWIPAYGIAVLLLSASYFLSRNPGHGLHWLAFALHLLALLLTALFFSTFTMDRLF